MSVLDQINRYLSEAGEVELHSLYEQMINNEFVRGQELAPTRSQWRLFFEKLKIGCEYVLKEYGPESLPCKLEFYGAAGIIGDEEGPNFIFYGPEEDEFGISFCYAAKQCVWFRTPDASRLLRAMSMRRFDERFPPGKTATPEDFVVLQAIEECYHRYQVVAKNMPWANTAKDRNHPAEIEAGHVMMQAIADLKITLQ